MPHEQVFAGRRAIAADVAEKGPLNTRGHGQEAIAMGLARD